MLSPPWQSPSCARCCCELASRAASASSSWACAGCRRPTYPWWASCVASCSPRRASLRAARSQGPCGL
eukprot:3784896-Pyramimonas_sp.AAC.1